MKNKLLSLLALFFVFGNCFGQVMFQKVINSPFGCVARDVKQTTDGGYIIAGDVNIPDSNTSASYLVKTDNKGNVLWTRSYGGGLNYGGYSVLQTTDGGYILAGGLYDAPSNREFIYIIKTDLNGDTSWTRKYTNPGDTHGNSIQQTFDGGYVVAGYSEGGLYLLRIAVNGDVIWGITYDPASLGSGNSVQQMPDSGFIVAGEIWSPSNLRRLLFLLRTKANGDTLWTKYYGGIKEDGAYSVQQQNDGGYIIAGVTYSFSQTSSGAVYLIKTDANGNSDCYENPANTIVTAPGAQRIPLVVVNYPNDTMEFTSTIINSTGQDSTLCLTVGIQELNNDNTFTLCPNPASSELRINPALTGAALSMIKPVVYIINTLGQIVYQSATDNWEPAINISSLSKGIYFVRINDEPQWWTGKFVKE